MHITPGIIIIILLKYIQSGYRVMYCLKMCLEVLSFPYRWHVIVWKIPLLSLIWAVTVLKAEMC